jgi:hypothetical protein
MAKFTTRPKTIGKGSLETQRNEQQQFEFQSTHEQHTNNTRTAQEQHTNSTRTALDTARHETQNEPRRNVRRIPANQIV